MKHVPVTVLDYGIGNLLNVVRALTHCGADVQVLSQASGTAPVAGHMVLPGVGAFGDGMAELRQRGLDDLVRRHAAAERPFLGICVGMQMLFEASEEMGEYPGLGLLPGRVQPVPAQGADGRPHRIPHIGWRALQAPGHTPDTSAAAWQGSLLDGQRPEERVYFVHSYAPVPSDPAVRLADADYDGVPVCAVVRRGPLVGCQFHPERSAEPGLAMLRRFLQS